VFEKLDANRVYDGASNIVEGDEVENVVVEEAHVVEDEVYP